MNKLEFFSTTILIFVLRNRDEILEENTCLLIYAAYILLISIYQYENGRFCDRNISKLNTRRSEIPEFYFYFQNIVIIVSCGISHLQMCCYYYQHHHYYNCCCTTSDIFIRAFQLRIPRPSRHFAASRALCPPTISRFEWQKRGEGGGTQI